MIVGFQGVTKEPLENVLYKISYKNLALFNAATPHYDDVEDEWDDRIDACNDANIDEDGDDEEYIR